jgi:PelA/Pel-15E family pectate lyase
LLQNKQSVYTTFDNRTTYSHIALLSKVYYVIKDEQYKKAALKGIEFILTAQYANGGYYSFILYKKIIVVI